jgi:hypothetical protein
MSGTYRDKLRTLAFSVPATRPDTKATVDHHDHATVTVTEHLSDRVDVHVAVAPLHAEVHLDA